ncbi:MAG: LytR family transcriptional protein [Chloroflexi bacterium]|nr:LytR family transcriptional protein [Chloroflexota bacterium]
MKSFRIPIIILLIISILVGCAPFQAAGLPVVVSQLGSAGQSVQGQEVTPVAPTPTPFQPIPPTPVYIPTDIPTPTPIPTPTGIPPTPTLDLSNIASLAEGVELSNVPNQVNILLLGADRRPKQKKFRTDTIILATLNSELGTLNLTSFPRDLYVTIPGMGQNRINTAYFFGGIDLLYQTFRENFGIRPDYYVLIDFSQFKRFVDSLGGLDVKVGQSVSDYRAGRYVTIKKGMQYMDADTVLWYVRTRKTTSDFSRNERQQEIIRAIFNRMLTLENIPKVKEFYDIYQDAVTTNMSLGDILPIIPLAVKLVDSSRINQYYIGPRQVYNWITPEGAMVLLPDVAAIRKIIRKSQNDQ